MRRATFGSTVVSRPRRPQIVGLAYKPCTIPQRCNLPMPFPTQAITVMIRRATLISKPVNRRTCDATLIARWEWHLHLDHQLRVVRSHESPLETMQKLCD